jgi:hypothetical protein
MSSSESSVVVATALHALLRVDGRPDEAGAGLVEEEREVLPARVDLELPVGAPFGGDPPMPDGNALQDPTEPQLPGIEDPGAVARLQRDHVRGESMSAHPQPELGETWPRPWNLIAVW